jgi:hypothetical protein
VVAFLALFTAVAFHDTKDAVGAARIVPRVVVLAFSILVLVGVLVSYDDQVWFPPN